MTPLADVAGTILKPISPEQAEYAMANGEFPHSMIASAKRVAIILTQDWCPQWSSMKHWLEKADPMSAELSGTHIFRLEYNRVPYFSRFMSFKETVWNNWLIPYVRYYRNGVLVDESNHVSQRDFFLKLDKEPD